MNTQNTSNSELLSPKFERILEVNCAMGRMIESAPILNDVFKVLAEQGWVAPSPEMPDMFMKPDDQGRALNGFLIVRASKVETFGSDPKREWTLQQFISGNQLSLLRNI